LGICIDREELLFKKHGLIDPFIEGGESSGKRDYQEMAPIYHRK